MQVDKQQISNMMNVRMRSSYLLICFFIACLPPNLNAHIWDCDVLPKNEDNFTRASFRLWIDDSIKAPSAILVLAPGFNGDGRDYVQNNTWRLFAKKHNLALLGIFFKSNIETAVPYHKMNGRSGSAFFESLVVLSIKSKVAAISSAPLLIWGTSAGGQLAYGLACIQPERVIAFAAIKGGIYETDYNPSVREVPGLFIIGGNDVVYRKENIIHIFEANRMANAVWCLAIESNAGHEIGKSNTIIIPFFEAVLQRRLPSNSNLSLLRIDASVGWLGFRDSLEVKDASTIDLFKRTNTVWLPNKKCAEAWAAFSRNY